VAATPAPDAPRPAAKSASGAVVQQTLEPNLLRPSAEPFTLGPGDAIEIEILGQAGTRNIATVGLDGKIYFHLLPGLDVWGLTLDQARDAMEKELGKFISQAQISVTLRTVGSRYVWLLGRVNRPGIYALPGTMTLLESLAMAGGTARSGSQVSTEELADLRHSFVIRGGQYLPVDFYRLLTAGDMSQNIYLRPDDFVYVPSALVNEVYVLGAVRAPRAVPYQEPMTVLSAVLGADGPARLELLSREDAGPFMPDAYLSHVTILRGSLTAPQVTVVDLQAIIKGRTTDVRLEAGDIVYVPNSPYTNLKRYINMAVTTFVSTVFANEGIRAGGGNLGINVSVPVGGTSSR
jgi:protein involved in polysaccharide export with SLBB domain